MKIRILILLSSLFIIWSCKNDFNIRIPSMSVSLRLNLLTTDHDLVPIYSSKRYIWKKENAMLEGERTGFGGILVFHGLENGIDTNPYYAFDLACPNEASPNVLLVINKKNEAVCSVCNSAFEITTGSGLPLRGDAKDRKFVLKKYQVIATNDMLYITN